MRFVEYCYIIIANVEEGKTMKPILRIIWTSYKKLDKLLLLAVTACSLLGVVLIYSIYKNDVSRYVFPSTYKTQAIAIVLGILISIFISFIDYQKLAKLWFLYAPFAVGMVILTFTSLGIQREGADDKAWLDIGITTLQPSEFLKLAFILSFAYHLSKVHEKINQPLNVLLLCVHGAVPIGLIALQGDFGTALVFTAIFLTMLFAGGISWKLVLSALMASPLLGLFAWNYILQSNHKKRILILFNPGHDPLGTGNQQRQGKIALGSGQLFGKGLFGGEYSYVSEVQNDFIFSYLGQTLGFIGCIVLCGLICFICLKLITNSLAAKDKLGQLISIGVFSLLFTHALLNIGMVLGVMPVIGVPLPFVSAGGTAVLSMYIAIGLAMSVYSHSEKKNSIFYDK